MTWLITGGAGYIGAHVARALHSAGERTAVLDDFSSGFAERLPDDVPVVRGSVSDRALLDRVFAEHGVSGVIHLAARKQVGESVERPLLYYRENVHGLTVLLEAVVAAGVGRFVLSSSAAVYGTPEADLVTEEAPCLPINPYGETKLAGEWLVRDAGRAHGISTACLRYFNVAGAAEPGLGDIGKSNVIPMFFEALTLGEAPQIFGGDYPTEDGTCVRDYIHVADLADAHLAAARTLAPGDGGDLTLNIGTGSGVSVHRLAGLVAEVTGIAEPAAEVVERRPGDPARVVALAERARTTLGWEPRHGVHAMVESAWRGWQLRHPEMR